jgi:hypothetical protein
MFRYAGGQTVRHGFYWNADKWQVTLVERQGGDLPGEARERYARVPVLAMLLVAPIMGALYVIFLPLIGFAMVFDYLARRAWRAVRAGAWGVLAAVAPHWRPGEAYLAERNRKKKKEEAQKIEADKKER